MLCVLFIADSAILTRPAIVPDQLGWSHSPTANLQTTNAHCAPNYGQRIHTQFPISDYHTSDEHHSAPTIRHRRSVAGRTGNELSFRVARRERWVARTKFKCNTCKRMQGVLSSSSPAPESAIMRITIFCSWRLGVVVAIAMVHARRSRVPRVQKDMCTIMAGPMSNRSPRAETTLAARVQWQFASACNIEIVK